MYVCYKERERERKYGFGRQPMLHALTTMLHASKCSKLYFSIWKNKLRFGESRLNEFKHQLNSKGFFNKQIAQTYHKINTKIQILHMHMLWFFFICCDLARQYCTRVQVKQVTSDNWFCWPAYNKWIKWYPLIINIFQVICKY